jgi:hypothetical protein
MLPILFQYECVKCERLRQSGNHIFTLHCPLFVPDFIYPLSHSIVLGIIQKLFKYFPSHPPNSKIKTSIGSDSSFPF